MAKRMNLTAAEISDKWNRRMKAAVPDIQRGVRASTIHPGEEAIKSKDKYLAGVQNSVTSGRFERGHKSYTLAQWQEQTATKTGERMATGVEQAMPKRQKFDEYMVKVIPALQTQVNSMPKNTIEDSIARMTAWTRGMAKNSYKG